MVEIEVHVWDAVLHLHVLELGLQGLRGVRVGFSSEESLLRLVVRVKVLLILAAALAAELMLRGSGNYRLEAAHALTILADLAELGIAGLALVAFSFHFLKVALDVLLDLLIPVRVDE